LLSRANKTRLHAVTLTLADDNTLTQIWTNYDKGKAAETVHFSFKRK